MAKVNTYKEDEVLKSKFDKSQLKKLISYSARYKWKILISLVFIIISSVSSLIGPLLTQKILDIHIPDGNIRMIIVFSVLYMATIGVQVLFMVFKAHIINDAGYSIVYDIRKDLFEHIQKLSFSFFDSRPTGKILTRITTYIDALGSIMSEGIVTLISDLVTLLGILIFMVYISPPLTLVCIATFIPIIFLSSIFRKHIHKNNKEVNRKTSNRTAFFHERLMGIKIIQSFTKEKHDLDINDGITEDITSFWLKVYKFSLLFPISINITNVTGTVLTYLVGWLLLEEGAITLGIIFAFSQYITKFWVPLDSMAAIFNQIVSSVANIESVFDMMDEPIDIKDAEDAYELPAITGNVEYKDVTFGYDKKTNILENVSFSVNPGERVAFVGPTGAGKTTVVSLLSRFYDIAGGQITIDGHDISKVTLKSLRTQMGIMMQDAFIFEGSILDNIRYGRLDATDEECIEAAKAIYADDFISRLPYGYKTRISERGSELSAGEKQLLSFARVVVSDPKILILDEATSSIDVNTEALIKTALDKLLEGRTSFVIAHRLSTIQNSDKIMYIADKGIAEYGTHAELLEKKGLYYKLVKSQQ